MPLSSQLAITIWDLSPTGGEGGKGHHVPFGGTTISLFEKDCTLRQGRQKCSVHRHKAADGLSTTTTPAILPRSRHADLDGTHEDDAEARIERLEKLLKKHEMGEIPRIDWLDQLTFRAIEQQDLLRPNTARIARRNINGTDQKQSKQDTHNKSDPLGSQNNSFFTLFIDFPRFDFPIAFTDHEYPPPAISSSHHQTPSSSNVTLKPPPGIHGGSPSSPLNPDDDPYGGRIVKIYDPEVFARDNPAESMHRRLVRSHRTSLLDRDLKPNAKIRDELNVSYIRRRNSIMRGTILVLVHFH